MKLPRPIRATARMALGHVLPRDPKTARPLQVAALPWRRSAQGRVEVLLVTTRRSGRWSVPKGWPMIGRSSARAAAREAFEEAGVEGAVDGREIGRFDHVKRHPLFGRLRCTVVIFPLRVERQLGAWPEKRQRKRRWSTPEDAAARVGAGALRPIIRDFGRSLRVADEGG